MLTKRTDLALESAELTVGKDRLMELPGVKVSRETRAGLAVTRVDVLDERGARALDKPAGSYITVELDALIHRADADFEDASALIAELIGGLLKLEPDSRILVVGLGNEDVTPDAVGPLAADNTLVTAHLVEQEPELFGGFRRVWVLRPGVLGTTGMESAEMVRAVCEKLRPDRIVCIDALAAREVGRLCRTVQLTDAGVVPGSGVGNSRAELSERTLGVPVVCLGIPTVVDAATLAADLTGAEPDRNIAGLMVTPRDIDSALRELSRLAAYGLNCALHDGLTTADIDMLLG